MSKWAANLDHKFLNLPDSTLHRYNLYDSYYTAHLLRELTTQLQDPARFSGQWKWFTEVVQPLQLAVLDMQSRGLLVDKAARHKFTLATSQELRDTDTRIRRTADELGFKYTDKFPNSDAQVAKLLFGTCELKSHKHTEGGRASVDQDALLRVLRSLRKRDEPFRELLYDLCHRSRLQTMLERYTGFEVDPDGRCRPQWKMAGTKTWRLAAAEPALLQFPEECRSYFMASPGCVFVSADWNQLEARLEAVIYDDEVSLKAFAENRDIHVENALDLMSYSHEHWEQLAPAAKERTRYFSKSWKYEIGYGGSGAGDKSKTFCPCPKCVDKVPQTLELKKPEILAAGERWFQRHPAVRRGQREILSFVQKHKYYESPFGVRRYFARTWGPDFERELKNCPFQTNAALLANKRWVVLHLMGAPILLQHYDSFMLEVPKTPASSVDQWQADLRGVMEEPVPELGGTVFPTTVKVGHTWAEC